MKTFFNWIKSLYLSRAELYEIIERQQVLILKLDRENHEQKVLLHRLDEENDALLDLIAHAEPWNED
jgi:uncharacterized Rmd1/YagE family protein